MHGVSIILLPSLDIGQILEVPMHEIASSHLRIYVVLKSLPLQSEVIVLQKHLIVRQLERLLR